MPEGKDITIYVVEVLNQAGDLISQFLHQTPVGANRHAAEYILGEAKDVLGLSGRTRDRVIAELQLLYDKEQYEELVKAWNELPENVRRYEVTVGWWTVPE